MYALVSSSSVTINTTETRSGKRIPLCDIQNISALDLIESCSLDNSAGTLKYVNNCFLSPPSGHYNL